jgi:hypothetical protein
VLSVYFAVLCDAIFRIGWNRFEHEFSTIDSKGDFVRNCISDLWEMSSRREMTEYVLFERISGVGGLKLPLSEALSTALDSSRGKHCAICTVCNDSLPMKYAFIAIQCGGHPHHPMTHPIRDEGFRDSNSVTASVCQTVSQRPYSPENWLSLAA